MKSHLNTFRNKGFSPFGHSLACALALSLASLSAGAADDAYGAGCEAARAADYETAFENWEPLVARGDGYAQFQLAMMYHAGLHVEQDEARAVELYHMAARNGVPEAREYLIAGYSNGWFGLPRDEALAAYWQHRLEMQRRSTAERRSPAAGPDRHRRPETERALARADAGS